ncbi:hypothetical protein ACP275_07G035100 [Erythranthe tilingii]
MSRLIRSSSLGASSADLLGRFYNPVAARENKQPPSAAVKPLQNKPAVAAAAQENKQPPIRPAHAVIKPVQNIPAAAAAEKQRKSIFTFNSPPRREIVNGREDFLDACALCNKRIIKGKDRYMYGYLQVFCSPACREGQIAIDENSTLRRRQLAGKLIGSYSNANY